MKYPGIENVIDQPVYDTVQVPIAAAGGVQSFFLVPLNGVLGAGVKTYAHTNLTMAGRLETGCSLEVHAMSMSVRPTNLAGVAPTLVDYRALNNTGHLNVLVGGQSVYHMSVLQMGTGLGELQYWSNIAAAVTEFQSNHGLGSYGNRYPLEYPIILEANEAIQVDLTFGVIVAAVDVLFTFWGKYTRPVR